MKSFKNTYRTVLCAMATIAVFSSASEAQSNSESAQKAVIELSEIVSPEVFSHLTPAEQSELRQELAAFNKDPFVRVADNSDRIWGKAFCVGGKAALLVGGIQGFKCLTTDKQIVAILATADRVAPALTGYFADGYVGINVGLSFLAGVAILSAPAQSFSWYGHFRRASEDSVDGGTVNGAYGPIGGFVAYYQRGEAALTIVAYQAGLAVEFGASAVQVLR